MNAAQKAWATRRARDAARAEQRERAAIAAAPPPKDKPAMVEFWSDFPRIGCGLRRFVVLSVGPKWATLFYVPLLATVQIDRLSFDRQVKPADFDPGNVARIIRRNVAQAKRLEHEYSAINANAALAALKGTDAQRIAA